MEQNSREQAQAFYDRAAQKWTAEDYEGAIADCNEAIRLDPTFADAYIRRGSVRRDLGTDAFPFDEPATRADFEAAQRIDPLNANVYWGLGVCARERGEEHAALLLYRRYLELAGEEGNEWMVKQVQAMEAAEAPPPPKIGRVDRLRKWFKRLTGVADGE